jgi:pilus assembly protein Flp/PilA
LGEAGHEVLLRKGDDPLARLRYREQSMFAKFKTFAADESGATAIEYALIASLIAVALVTILGTLGTRLSQEFSEVSSALK